MLSFNKYKFYQKLMPYGSQWLCLNLILTHNYFFKYINFLYKLNNSIFMLYQSKSTFLQYYKFLNILYNLYDEKTTNIIVVSTWKTKEFKKFIDNWCYKLNFYCHDARYLGLFSNKGGFSFKKPQLKFISIRYDAILFLDISKDSSKIIKEASKMGVVSIGFNFISTESNILKYLDYLVPFTLGCMYTINWIFSLLYYIFLRSNNSKILI